MMKQDIVCKKCSYVMGSINDASFEQLSSRTLDIFNKEQASCPKCSAQHPWVANKTYLPSISPAYKMPIH